MEPSLAWLLQPLEVETFLNEIWGATHYHVKRGCAGYFDSLLRAPSAIEELLELFRRDPSTVHLLKGEDRRSGSDSYRLADGSLDLVRVRNDFADGYTIILGGVERYMRAVGSLAHSIEVELNYPIQVNAYITPPETQGLIPHYDDHDVFFLQVHGSKLWHLYDGPSVPPRELQPEKNKAVAIDGLPLRADLRLEVGDVLYLPRGQVHAAETNSEPSAHLTVGFHPPTMLTLAIAALSAQRFHDDRLNAYLPPRHLDDADVQADLADLLRDAVKAVEDQGAVARGLDVLADRLVRRGRIPPIGPASNAARIDGQTLVRKYQPLYSRVRAVDGGVALRFAGLSVRAGTDHKAAMLFIARSAEPFRVCDLPGLGAQEQIELARSLIVSGFLVRVQD
ncbi:cupin [Mycobacterium mantenii]|uniref:Cupin n=1 Tax=Mycobacterium mantenii TaxID=560555 RepID=A0A1X0FPF8_MYCNT|nr:cupin [Mycobacterium mantenii]